VESPVVLFITYIMLFFANVVHVIEHSVGVLRSVCYFCHLVTTRVIIVPAKTTFYETWSIR
jgi:hypothetical protein